MTDPHIIIDGSTSLPSRAEETLALAFQDDPALAWIFPDAAARHRRLLRFFAWRFADHVRHGMILTSPDTVGKHLARHVSTGEDFLYLRYAAVRPEAQGKGWGGRAIRAGIAEANRLGVDTCLETAKQSNVAIYQRLGFDIVDEWQVPGGPRFWTMVRPQD